jgi:hypothetical protein
LGESLFLSLLIICPLSWASIGALAEKLDEIEKGQTTQSVLLDSYKSKTSLTIHQQVKLSDKDFYQRLEGFKTPFISATTRGLGGPLDNVKLKLIGMVDNFIQSSLQGRQEPRGNSIWTVYHCQSTP